MVGVGDGDENTHCRYQCHCVTQPQSHCHTATFTICHCHRPCHLAHLFCTTVRMVSPGVLMAAPNTPAQKPLSSWLSTREYCCLEGCGYWVGGWVRGR